MRRREGKHFTVSKRVLGVGLLAAAMAGGSLAVSAADKGAPKPAGPAVDAGASSAKSSDAASNVRITIQTVPPRRALVRWGRKTMGSIPAPRPLVIERPRDSGPMDLVIRASGYLPVHTRAYTFTDSRVSVKLTAPEDKSTLFGYRQEPIPATPDGGVPALAPAPGTPGAAPGPTPGAAPGPTPGAAPGPTPEAAPGPTPPAPPVAPTPGTGP
jgi:hypothetical protein